MLKNILIIVVIVVCGLYVYQKQQVEQPVPSTAFRKVDESALKGLEGKLPSVIFEKDIQPVIERNRQGGLTQEELNAFLDKLDTIGRALGDKVTESVNQAGHAIAPDLFPRKTLAERSADIAESLAGAAEKGAKAGLPVLQEAARDVLHALAVALSCLLDRAADLLQGK